MTNLRKVLLDNNVKFLPFCLNDFILQMKDRKTSINDKKALLNDIFSAWEILFSKLYTYEHLTKQRKALLNYNAYISIFVCQSY